LFNAPGSIQVQTPGRDPPLKALLSRQRGTAWARIIFQLLDWRCCAVARLPRRKQPSMVRAWQSLMSLWPKSFGRTMTHLDNAFDMRAERSRRGNAAEAPPVERAAGGGKSRGRRGQK